MFIFSVGVCLFSWATLTCAAEISPLFLTPYIKNNKTSEGRNLSRVDHKQFLNVTSYSGYFTVDEKYDSNIFFWYFPVAGANVSLTPLIIWLQGGPGATSLFATFKEIGPFDFNASATGNLTLKLGLKSEQSSWARNHSLLFIDNPVGSGFSFTNDTNSYVTTVNKCADHLHIFLQQFLTVYPEVRQAPLFVAGESYAGKYVPAFARKVLDSKRADGEERKINLQGLIMGNPVFNHKDTANYSEIFYQWGLIDKQGMLAVKDLQDAYITAINNNDTSVSSTISGKLLNRLIHLSQIHWLYNALQYKDLESDDLVKYLNTAKFKESVHAKDLSIELVSDEVQKKLLPEFLINMDSTMNLLLEHYRILIYCGQLDLRASCVQSAAARRENWFWSGRPAFLKAERKPLLENQQITGYYKSGGGLTEVLVTEAGHMVPIDKPKEARILVSLFIKGEEPNFQQHPNLSFNDVPDLDQFNNDTNLTRDTVVIRTNPINTFSWVLNGILITAIVICGVLYMRHKRRTHDYLINDDDSLNNAVLTMS